jgi:transposase
VRPVSAREQRRKLAFEWLRRGVPKAEIARRLNVSYTAVRNWERRQRDQGPNGWREARHPGPARKLTVEQHRRLRRILLEGAQAHGYATDLWTLKRVAEVVEKEFGEEYTESGVWHVLRDLGFSAQIPLPRALERNEPYIRQWVRVEWPRIVARARRQGATILFLDESYKQSAPNVRRTWWLEGVRPEIRVREGNRMKLSLISAVGARGELYFEVHEENIDGGRVIEFLTYLLKEVPGRIMLLWDNGTIHRREDVKAFLYEQRRRLETHRFPAYAPELNPDEMVWNALKYQRLANWCPKTTEEIREGVEREMAWLQAHPEVVAACIQNAAIPLPG